MLRELNYCAFRKYTVFLAASQLLLAPPSRSRFHRQDLLRLIKAWFPVDLRGGGLK